MFVSRKVAEGGGDGTRLVRFLSCLINDVRSCGGRRGGVSQYSQSKAPTLPGLRVQFPAAIELGSKASVESTPLTNESFISHGVDV